MNWFVRWECPKTVPGFTSTRFPFAISKTTCDTGICASCRHGQEVPSKGARQDPVCTLDIPMRAWASACHGIQTNPSRAAAPCRASTRTGDSPATAPPQALGGGGILTEPGPDWDVWLLGEDPRLDYSVIIRQGQLHGHSRGGGTVDGTHNLHSLATFIPGDGWGPITVYRLDEILDL